MKLTIGFALQSYLLLSVWRANGHRPGGNCGASERPALTMILCCFSSSKYFNLREDAQGTVIIRTFYSTKGNHKSRQGDDSGWCLASKDSSLDPNTHLPKWNRELRIRNKIGMTKPLCPVLQRLFFPSFARKPSCLWVIRHSHVQPSGFIKS